MVARGERRLRRPSIRSDRDAAARLAVPSKHGAQPLRVAIASTTAMICLVALTILTMSRSCIIERLKSLGAHTSESTGHGGVKHPGLPGNDARVFTGREGRQVEVADTVRGFKEILDGKHDGVPEGNFYMKGGIEEIQKS